MQTFDNYFICQENKMAALLAGSVSLQSDVDECNPLFIYGGTGLGKTHLLKAIKNKHEEESPGCKVIYVTIDDFVCEFIQSIQSNQQFEFKKKYLQPDILLIDELDDIVEKFETQKELLHIINSLLSRDIQIVISSCKSPIKILINDRTMIRRMNSVITGIDNPGYDSRQDFLINYIIKNDIPCSDSIAKFIAEKVKTNFSVLGSVMASIDKTSKFSGEEITIKVVESYLESYLKK